MDEPTAGLDPEERVRIRNLLGKISANAAVLHDELTTRGASVTRPLEDRPWSCRDFYVEDPDGYILCFSERTS